MRPLIEETSPLAEAFAAAGHRLYLVGGVVRDAILDRLRPDLDLDFTTDALPEQTERVLAGAGVDAVWTQGKKFGTIGARVKGRTVEITTHRADAYSPDSRKPEVVFADAVEADLSRRDFTVNAMALSLPDLRLIDPFGGAADLAASRLRTPLSPEESFSDDPLRMMRAARFIAGYDLTPDPELVAAVTSMRARLDIVSDERIRDELDKLMVVERPGPGLWFLVQTGLAEEFLPELPALGLEQDPIHRHKDVLAHTIAVIEKTSPDRLLRLAALFHDVGKPKTRSFGPRGAPGRTPPALPHLPDGLDRLGRPSLRARRRPAPAAAERADPLRLHHPQRDQGPGPVSPHGRAGGPHRRAPGAGGAEVHPARPGRQRGHGPSGAPTGA
jgi:poly(A) polymerase